MSHHKTTTPLVETKKEDAIPQDMTATPPEPIPVEGHIAEPEKPTEVPTAPPVNPLELYQAAKIRTESRIRTGGTIRQGKGKIGADCLACIIVGSFIVNHSDEVYLNGLIRKEGKLVMFGMRAIYKVIQHFAGVDGVDTNKSGQGVHGTFYQISSVGLGNQDKAGKNKIAQYGVYFFREGRISIDSGEMFSRPEFTYQDFPEDMVRNAARYLAARFIPGAEPEAFNPGLTKKEEPKAEAPAVTPE